MGYKKFDCDWILGVCSSDLCSTPTRLSHKTCSPPPIGTSWNNPPGAAGAARQNRFRHALGQTPRGEGRFHSDVEAHPPRQRQFARVVDGVGGTAHVGAPG